MTSYPNCELFVLVEECLFWGAILNSSSPNYPNLLVAFQWLKSHGWPFDSFYHTLYADKDLLLEYLEYMEKF